MVVYVSLLGRTDGSLLLRAARMQLLDAGARASRFDFVFWRSLKTPEHGCHVKFAFAVFACLRVSMFAAIIIFFFSLFSFFYYINFLFVWLLIICSAPVAFPSLYIFA